MNLDIIARLVQILRDAPELGAIEVRRGLFGAWSAVRVSRAGHASGSGDHVVVAHASTSPTSPPERGTARAEGRADGAPGGAGGGAPRAGSRRPRTARDQVTDGGDVLRRAPAGR